MKKDATAEQIDHMVGRVQQLGLKPHVINGTERTVIAVVGDDRKTYKESLESGPGVAEVVPILAPYKIASREVQAGAHGRARRQLDGRRRHGRRHRRALLGRKRRANSRHGQGGESRRGDGLRGGAFKPRTSPYSFQGLKEDGLKMLAAAREATGLAIVTEVMATEDVDLVASYADVLQIGARNMQNYRLLEAVGKTDRPVLLKRGPSATIEELLLAAEYILDAGNQQVMLCERGIRTFETHTRFTLPLATVVYLHGKTHLPVVVDPSHGTGHTWLVPQMCAASVAAGADGLIIEVHPDPENALSDGNQSLDFDQFRETMDTCRKVADALGRKLGNGR